MSERVIYLLGVVLMGWAVTFGLRALPFLLFAGKARKLPPWVEKVGNFVSPVIIGGLIVYSYSGLEWKTAWPYLAGLLTVGLQLVAKNSLVSIISGTAVYMCLISCGCATSQPLESFDAEHPAFSVTVTDIKFGDRPVSPAEAPSLLEEADVPRDRTIHILLDPEVTNLKPARTLMFFLARGGYTRSVLVTKRHGESYTTGKKVQPKKQQQAGNEPIRIRYKKSNE